MGRRLHIFSPQSSAQSIGVQAYNLAMLATALLIRSAVVGGSNGGFVYVSTDDSDDDGHCQGRKV